MPVLSEKNRRFGMQFVLLLAVIGALLCLAGCSGSSGGGDSNGGATDDESQFKGDYIQKLIDEKDSGSTITIPPGIYTSIDFGGKDITLRSTDPDDAQVVAATIIDGGGDGPVINFSTGEGSGAVVEGFTIRNGGGKLVDNGSNTSYYGGGIYIKNASPVIRKNVITMNTANVGGGIYIEGDCAPEIRGNHLLQNQTSGALYNHGGGGIAVVDNKLTVASIVDNRIEGNSTEHFGGGIQIRDSAVIVNGNEICENTGVNEGGSGNGGGIHVAIFEDANCNAPQIENNLIKMNEADSRGGGLYIYNLLADAVFVVKENNFVENTVGDEDSEFAAYGGGVCISGNLVTFDSNTFSQNTAKNSGGGLFVDYTVESQAAILNNTFTRNTPNDTYDPSGSLVDQGGNIYN